MKSDGFTSQTTQVLESDIDDKDIQTIQRCVEAVEAASFVKLNI